MQVPSHRRRPDRSSLVASCTPPGSRPAGSRQRPPAKSIADEGAGAQQIDGFMPLYWDERTGKLWMEISALRHGAPLPGVAAGRRRLEPDRPRPRAAGRLGARDVFERIGPKVLMIAAELPVPRDHRRRRRAAGGGAVVRAVGALGIQGGGRRGRPRPRGRDRLLPPRRARRRRSAAAGQAGALPRGRQPRRRSTCRARRGSRRTPRSRRRSPSRPTRTRAGSCAR